jgi:hypothetical protein
VEEEDDDVDVDYGYGYDYYDRDRDYDDDYDYDYDDDDDAAATAPTAYISSVHASPTRAPVWTTGRECGCACACARVCIYICAVEPPRRDNGVGPPLTTVVLPSSSASPSVTRVRARDSPHPPSSFCYSSDRRSAPLPPTFSLDIPPDSATPTPSHPTPSLHLSLSLSLLPFPTPLPNLPNAPSPHLSISTSPHLYLSNYPTIRLSIHLTIRLSLSLSLSPSLSVCLIPCWLLNATARTAAGRDDELHHEEEGLQRTRVRIPFCLRLNNYYSLNRDISRARSEGLTGGWPSRFVPTSL